MQILMSFKYFYPVFRTCVEKLLDSFPSKYLRTCKCNKCLKGQSQPWANGSNLDADRQNISKGQNSLFNFHISLKETKSIY